MVDALDLLMIVNHETTIKPSCRKETETETEFQVIFAYFSNKKTLYFHCFVRFPKHLDQCK